MDCSAASSAEGSSVRPSERIDEACDRFEAAWRSGSAPRIEGYLAEALEVDRPALLGELVALERELRRHRGEWPETEEYLERFAGDASVVAAALQETSAAIEGRADKIAMAMTGDVGCNGTGGGRRLPDVLSATAVYRPQRHHARGGLGEVLVAYQEELDRAVALKRVRPDKLHEEARRRFYREAAITARLQHPGIVPIYGLGQDKDGPFYTMPLIEGQTLQEAIDAFHAEESSGRDPGRRALRFRGLLQQLIAVCDTMAYVHDQGVIHRDLKPSNIMLGRYGETLVMDWGLAKAFEREEAAGSAGEETLTPGAAGGSVTPTVGAVGTPAYMSPEQAEARWDLVGPASDIFALGGNLYAILTGRAPFQGENAGRILEQVRRCEFPAPRQVKAAVPRALEAVCLKAMARGREDRYRSALDLAADIRRWLADQPVSAFREGLLTRILRWMRRHPAAVPLASFLCLCDGIILFTLLSSLIDSIRFPFLAFGVLVIVLVPSIGVGLQGGAIVGGTIGAVLGVIRYGIKGGLRRGADQGLKIGAASGAGLGAILGGILALRMAIDFGLSRLWTG
jgi:serine/threonine protein kinase